ncbi:hypothetical protein DICVIV_14068 [Dictyocaulus viviparus]|uniref:WAPL domain-containing protein n=1 Tax=Dictyocaulus viviparus TaxID=29172 RepID=A0A0D8X8Q8_DICVI|nr:hypothetical protein DICVIV_14068 [Dictyocaulus viviparus]
MSSCEHNDLEDDSKTLIESFIKAEEVIEEIENGRHSVDLQKRIKTAINTLEMLARNVSVLDLFSDNEEVDDLSTSSLRFLLISCYLGVAHHNIVTEPSQREEQLRLAKVVTLLILL